MDVAIAPSELLSKTNVVVMLFSVVLTVIIISFLNQQVFKCYNSDLTERLLPDATFINLSDFGQ